MSKITAVIITKNEEEMLPGCLDSLDFVDQLLVIDSNSKDATVKIAQKAKAAVYKHDFIDFSDSRNFALTKITTDWVFYIDADERVSDELKKGIVRFINTDNSAGYFLRKNYYLGREWPYKEKVTRLFNRKYFTEWRGELHETPGFKGQAVEIPGELLHFTHRTIGQMLTKTIEWSKVEAKLRYQKKHPEITWWRLVRVFGSGFGNSYFKQKGYRAGPVGLIESIYQGFSLFITYIRLWEMQNRIELP